MFKSGFVTIIGAPNVGKSTFLNTITGYKVAITSNKAQTTRNSIKGIVTQDDYQIIFIDTPGLFKSNNKLNDFMIGQINNSLSDPDMIIYMIDGKFGLGKRDQEIFSKGFQKNIPLLIIINKIDLIDQKQIEKIISEINSYELNAEIITLSMKSQWNRESLLNQIAKKLPEGPQYYDKNSVTDSPEGFMVAEIIREKILKKTREEIPHSIAIKVEKIIKNKKIIKIKAYIYVERKSQRQVVIGKQGQMIKEIGKAARLELENWYQNSVFLELEVKDSKNWRDLDQSLKNFGYFEE